jgi:hypothetical protein
MNFSSNKLFEPAAYLEGCWKRIKQVAEKGKPPAPLPPTSMGLPAVT